MWIRERLGAFGGESPKDLACALIEESAAHGGATDDRTALLIRVARRT